MHILNSMLAFVLWLWKSSQMHEYRFIQMLNKIQAQSRQITSRMLKNSFLSEICIFTRPFANLLFFLSVPQQQPWAVVCII